MGTRSVGPPPGGRLAQRRRRTALTWVVEMVRRHWFVPAAIVLCSKLGQDIAVNSAVQDRVRQNESRLAALEARREAAVLRAQALKTPEGREVFLKENGYGNRGERRILVSREVLDQLRPESTPPESNLAGKEKKKWPSRIGKALADFFAACSARVQHALGK